MLNHLLVQSIPVWVLVHIAIATVYRAPLLKIVIYWYALERYSYSLGHPSLLAFSKIIES